MVQTIPPCSVEGGAMTLSDRLTLLEQACRNAREFGVSSALMRGECKVAPRLLLAGVMQETNGHTQAKVTDPNGPKFQQANHFSRVWVESLLAAKGNAVMLVQEVDDAIREVLDDLAHVGVKVEMSQ